MFQDHSLLSTTDREGEVPFGSGLETRKIRKTRLFTPSSNLWMDRGEVRSLDPVPKVLYTSLSGNLGILCHSLRSSCLQSPVEDLCPSVNQSRRYGFQYFLQHVGNPPLLGSYRSRHQASHPPKWDPNRNRCRMPEDLDDHLPVSGTPTDHPWE